MRYTSNGKRLVNGVDDMSPTAYDYHGAYSEENEKAKEVTQASAYLAELGKYYNWGTWECFEDIRMEHDACRNGVAVFDTSSLNKMRISGEG